MSTKLLYIGVLLSLSLALQAQEKEKKAIQQSAEAFSAAFVKGDVNKMMRYYTQDALIFPPNGKDMLKGQEALRKYWTLPSTIKMLWHKSTSTSLEIQGNTAYDYGYYEGQNAKDGKENPPFKGKYVIVWKKSKGKWKMYLDIWNRVPSDNP